ncbi:hypothetical protein NJ76_23320 [Rhodococcus sp. IITR03]|nr:hypothetical protein NJ76_23320 [Rhodococcus sp. IITR03]
MELLFKTLKYGPMWRCSFTPVHSIPNDSGRAVPRRSATDVWINKPTVDIETGGPDVDQAAA